MPTEPAGLMHFASYYRWLVIREWQRVSPEDRLLDVGCDDGEIVARVRAAQRVALDLNPRCRDAAVRLIRADARFLLVPSGRFDTVLGFDLIEHIDDDRAVLAEMVRALAPGGTLWISTPSVHWKIFPAFLTARAARGFGHVRNGYSLAELHERLPAGLEVEVRTWNEAAFRFMFAVLRVVDAVSSPLARNLAGWCYHLDRRRPEGQGGHLFVRVRREAADALSRRERARVRASGRHHRPPVSEQAHERFDLAQQTRAEGPRW
ncbi:MAG: class I SAM-dependent methyltransferase [Anaerolineales bacterium]|nr:class I SAM-dependent methyltransferase [Anaerolineales bacterium]